jgi:hypothetical protein
LVQEWEKKIDVDGFVFFNGENHLLSFFDIIKGQSGEIDAESSNRQLFSCSNS